MVFSLALATLGTTATSWRLLYLSMMITTLVALAGNIEVAILGNEQSVFAWLEAVVPPLVVLSTAYVLKGQLLETIEQRHAAERAYQAAAANPEGHPRWAQLQANALQDALRKVNSRRKDALAAMTSEEWRSAVYREMQANLWYEEPEMDDQSDPDALSIMALAPLQGNRNDSRPKVIAAVSGTV